MIGTTNLACIKLNRKSIIYIQILHIYISIYSSADKRTERQYCQTECYLHLRSKK